MKKRRVLIIFANPKGTEEIQLLEEEVVIKEALDLAKYKDKLEVKFVRASTIHDLRRHLLNERFHIVHISCHGTEKGLIFENKDGTPHHIEAAAFADWIKKFDSLECLIFNACHSLSQGLLTSLSVPVTIAMQDKLSDQAAIEFSRGFYDAVGVGKDYEFAYQEGCDNVKMCLPKAKFNAKILKKNSTRETEFIIDDEPPMPPDEINVFINIWYSPKKYSLSDSRDTEVGTLYVYEDHLKYKNFKIDLQISGINDVRHTKMSGDINNNWVEVIYNEVDSTKSAYFADASKLGIGTLLGGSKELFEFLHRHFEPALPADPPENFGGNTGNDVNVKGNGNITSGGNISGNTIISGNITGKRWKKKKK